MSRSVLKLSQLFDQAIARRSLVSIRNGELRRDQFAPECGYTYVLDSWLPRGVSCAFCRFVPASNSSLKITVEGNYRLVACIGGGWLALPTGQEKFCYWIPHEPIFRTFDKNGHILAERRAEIKALSSTECCSCVEIESSREAFLDWLFWRVPASGTQLIEWLQSLSNLERQPHFLWGSHTTYRRPADVYNHLIYGQVYENRYLWPFHRKSCSENDAHALYVTLCGLQRASGKQLYAFLKDQLLLSVLARQSDDGGWHHGEWSEDMEAHLRLNGSAIHMLLDSLADREDPAVKNALKRAVGFVSQHTDEMAVGAWLLHDSLELTEAGMKKSPFKWLPSRVLGKSRSNMLVLNTHLDSLVLLDRYRQVTGDTCHAKLVDSGRRATKAVLNLHPLEFFYWVFVWMFRLNLLPTKAQIDLPLPLRALKRAAWKWLEPNFYQVTARFPRFVMPGGYIERAMTLQGMADDYHSINVMDLARYSRRFSLDGVDQVVHNAVGFVRQNDVLAHWAENKWKNYAAGFWAEAIYHWYIAAPEEEKLVHLVEVIIKLEEHEIGLPPSLLGANAEAVPIRSQVSCPSPTDTHLRVVNLSRVEQIEFLVVNPTEVSRELCWESAPPVPLGWSNGDGGNVEGGKGIQIPARGWVVGRGVANESVRVTCNYPEQTDQGGSSIWKFVALHC